MTWRSSLLHIPHQFHPMPAHLLWNWSGFSMQSTPQASSLKCVWNWWHHGIPNINLRTWQINCSVCHLERLLVLMHLHILAVSHHRFMNKGYRERHLLQPSRHKFLNPSLFMFVQCYVSYTVFKFSTLLKNWPSSLLHTFAIFCSFVWHCIWQHLLLRIFLFSHGLRGLCLGKWIGKCQETVTDVRNILYLYNI